MAIEDTKRLEALLQQAGVESSLPAFPESRPHSNLLDVYRNYLAHTLTQHTGCEASKAYEAIQCTNDEADFVVAVPRLQLKGLDKKNPSEDLLQNFPRSPLFGFPVADKALLRFTISGSPLSRILLPYILDRAASYGTVSSVDQTPDAISGTARKKVLIEFSSPNLTKQFDGDYLRSSLLGQSIASLYLGTGWTVSTTNFIGDWGPHMGLLAAGWKRYGSEQLLEADALQHLLDVFSKVDKLRLKEEIMDDQSTENGDSAVNGSFTISEERDEFFHKLESGDKDAFELWRRLRDASISAYKDIYASLNIVFDEYLGESDVSQESIAEIENKLWEGGYSEEHEGARIIDFKKHGFKTLAKGTLRSAAGASSYLLRHAAAALDQSRKEAFDEMVYVASAKQDIHFQQLFKILELVGNSDLSSRLHHVSFRKLEGLVQGSSSPGLLLRDIFTDCQHSVHANLRAQEDTIMQGIGTDPKLEHINALTTLILSTQILSTKRSTNQTLKIQEMPNAEEYTGMTLQHCLNELRSRLREDSFRLEGLDAVDFSSISTIEEYTDTMRLLAQFTGIVHSVLESLEPSIMLDYLFRLTDQLGMVWELEIENHDGLPDQNARTVFYEGARIVVENGMRMLGLVPLKL